MEARMMHKDDDDAGQPDWKGMDIGITANRGHETVRESLLS